MTETSNPSTADQSAGGAAPASPSVNASKLSSNYINFCRVAGMSEELIIDFGLSTDPAEMSQGSVIATERVVLSYYTGKRMLEALQLTISRHEEAFGTLEMDIDKRFVPGWRG